MADRLGILLRHSPYGRIQAAEALRHAGGALAKGWEVTLILMGDGVYSGLPHQCSSDGAWTNLADSMRKLLKESDGRIRLCVDEQSLAERGLGRSDLFGDCRLVSMEELAKLLTESSQVLIF
jgi:sulfur relay (sulfurtransferase) DsrF/TusC family protein